MTHRRSVCIIHRKDVCNGELSYRLKKQAVETLRRLRSRHHACNQNPFKSTLGVQRKKGLNLQVGKVIKLESMLF